MIKMTLRDTEKNHEPEGRKKRQRVELGKRTGPVKTRRGKAVWTIEKRKEDRKRRRMRRRKWKQTELFNKAKEEKEVRIITWNQQKLSMRPNNRRRLREVANWCMMRKWRIVLISEIIADNEGVIHLGEGKRQTIIIHGKRAAIMLSREWAIRWQREGEIKECGDRVVSVRIGDLVLVAVYQPLWKYGNMQIEQYRQELEEKLQRTRRDDVIIIGGDHNSSVGPGEGENWQPGICGKYGLGTTNEAGKDLLNWCQLNGLSWINSFKNIKERGTWYNKKWKKWHELDGFIVKQDQRRKMGEMTVIKEDSFSDHRPVTVILKYQVKEKRRRGAVKKKKLDLEKFENEEIRTEYQTKTREWTRERIGEGVNWEQMNRGLVELTEGVCGKAERKIDSPWMRGKEEEAIRLRGVISEKTQKMRETEQQRGNIEEAREELRVARRVYKKRKKQWEKEYWDRILKDAAEARDRNDMGKMFKLLRKLGMRDCKVTRPTEHFSVEEYKSHFEKVSQNRQEVTNQVMSWALDRVDDMRNDDRIREAGEELEKNLEREEIEKAIREIKDGAPGIDGVSIKMVKYADKTCKEKIIQLIQNMYESPSTDWEDCIKVGLVVPLFKKGERTNINNYRGVCLLTMGSRILAKVLANRLRDWTEKIGVLEENQQGFRRGRSTADAAQIFIRINEEMDNIKRNRVSLGRDREMMDDPVAILTDITKAYPRVNRIMLWHILDMWGMKEKMKRVLRGIHEGTEYQVRGREVNSSEWIPRRGLREGCATSPVLFNIYHSNVIRIAREERKRMEPECGTPWRWVPGNSLPPRDRQRASRGSASTTTTLTESLFADDTTICGNMREIESGKAEMVRVMECFEEKCHPDKEEELRFGEESAEKIRMLGVFIGRGVDVEERLKRMRKSSFILRKRIKNSKLSKRHQAKIVELCVESSGLFNCSIRPWHVAEIRKLQRYIDKLYRYIWSNKKKQPLREMQEKGVNMFQVRKTLGVGSLELKIEKRTLERLGHVLRMKNDRVVKQITLGWSVILENQRKHRQTTIDYYRKTIERAGLDYECIEDLVMDRNKWRNIVRKREKEINQWEHQMAEKRSTRRERDKKKEDSKVCRECGKWFETTKGMKIHYGRMHKANREERDNCSKCGEEFKDRATKTNHERECEGKERGRCPVCNQLRSIANMARHKRRCREKYGVAVEEREEEDYGRDTAGTRQGGRRKGTCDRCGCVLLKKNMARHRGTCGVELTRRRKTCRYCGKDLSESYVKKHELVCKKEQEERVVDRQTPLGADRA